MILYYLTLTVWLVPPLFRVASFSANWKHQHEHEHISLYFTNLYSDAKFTFIFIFSIYLLFYSFRISINFFCWYSVRVDLIENFVKKYVKQSNWTDEWMNDGVALPSCIGCKRLFYVKNRNKIREHRPTWSRRTNVQLKSIGSKMLKHSKR